MRTPASPPERFHSIIALMLGRWAAVLVVVLVLVPGVAHADSSCGDLPCETITAEAETTDAWRSPNYLRAVLELSMFVGLGGAWYWIDRDRQVADWDFPTIKERFTREVYVNDHNPFGINWVWHTVGGTYFHLAGRTNDLGLWESAGLALGASLVWEYGIEYREKVSVNDILFTNWAGMASGEFVHWLGRLLHQEYPGIAGEFARWTVGAAQTVHDRIDGRSSARGPKIRHQFRISSGYGRGSNSQVNGESSTDDVGLVGFRFEGRLAALSDYLRPGKRAKGFYDGNLTAVEARHSRAGSGNGTYFLADTVLLGWRQEQVEEDGTGVGVAVGTSVGVRYLREKWDGWYDRLGAVHLPGLAIDSVVRGNGWTLRTKARAHADYGGVHANSYRRWADANPGEMGKTVLEREGYYYAWGLSGRFRADLEIASRLELGTSLFYGQYRSQQNFDRFQSMLTVDQIGRKGFFDYDAWLRARIYGRSYVEVRRMGQRRSSTFEDLEASASQTRHTVQVGTTF